MGLSTVVGSLCALILFSVAVDAALPTADEITAMAQGGFRGLDANSDGVMTQTEWNMFKSAADVDGDGRMSLKEFIVVSGSPISIGTSIFNMVDKSHTGYISGTQLDREFELMDNNANGQVTEVEFTAFYRKLWTQIELVAQVG